MADTQFEGLDDVVADSIKSQQADMAVQIRNNAMGAVGTNPDTEAQMNSLAKTTGTPIDTVRAMPDVIKQQAAAQSINAETLTQTHPATSRVLAQPDAMKLAQDDISNMKDLEGVLAPPNPGLIGSLGDKYALSAARVYYGYKAQIGDLINNPDMVQDANRQTSIANQVDEEVTPKFDSTLGRWTYGAASGLVNSAPAILTSFLNPGAGVAMFGAQAEAEGYGKYRARGGTAAEATTGGVAEGAITAATSFLPVKFLTSQMGKLGAGKFLTGLFARDLPMMEAQALATSAVDESVANPNGSFEDWKAKLPENLGQAATSALMFAGTFAGIHAGVTYHAEGQARAEAAQKNAETLQTLNTLAGASKVRARDAQTFNDFITDANQNSAVQDLYVDPKALAQAGIDPKGIAQALPAMDEQVQTAIATGGDIKIPVSDFATHLAGTDFGQSLIDHLRTDPLGMSKVEADEYMKSSGDQLQGEVEKVLAAKQGDDSFKDSMQAVHESVLGKLGDANRFAPDVNRPYASLLSNFYGVQAARLGITPEEMYARYPVDIKAPSGEAKPNELNDVNQDNTELPEKEPPATTAELNQASMPDGFKQFVEMAKSAKDTDDFMNKARDIKISSDVSDWFGERYDEPTPKMAAEKFMKDVAAGEFGQPTEDANVSRRGSFNPETSTINLFHAADLSTFLHESGHFFLETLNKMALDANAPPEIKDDMNATLKWLGVSDIVEWNAHDLEWQRDKHEQFARGFEAYLFEGKSPSIEMRGVFQRFGAWLMNVYKSVKELNVQLSPDIRAVFDRLVATRDQIKQAEGYARFEPFFKTPEEAKMSMDEFKSYHDLGTQATADAVGNLETRSMKDMQWLSNAKGRILRGMQKDAAAKRANVRREVTDEVMNEPVNKARTFFKRGELNGEKVEGTPHRLDIEETKAMAQDMYGVGEHFPLEELESKYGKYGVLGKDGMHPQTAAELFGFDSGPDMLRSLLDAENPVEKIAGLTDQRMLERYGDLTDPATLDRAANQAIHNETRAKFLATEANALQKAVGGKKILAKAAKSFAEQMVGRMKVRNLKPGQFAAAEMRAARNAENARTKGNLPEAAIEKRNQLIQNYATKAAHEGLDAIDKGLNYLNRFDRKATRKAVGGEYMAQIDGILDRFDLSRSTSLKEIGRRVSLKEWYDAQVEKGYDPAIDDKLMNEAQKMSYKDMSVDSFKALLDSVKSIEHLGRLKQKLTDLKESRDLDAVVAEAVAAMSKLPQKETPDPRNPGAGGKGLDKINAKYLNGKSLLKSADASLLKMEQLFDWLDSHDPSGTFNRVVFRRIADAQGKEHELQVPISKALKDLANNMPEGARKDFLNRYTLPELVDSKTGKASSMLKSEILSVALNTGNASNFQKMLAGEKWKASDVKTVLDRHMTKGDWDFVQGVWDSINSLWPHIEAMEKRLSGVAPPKVDPMPVETPHGTYAGGYYPVVYDPLRSHDVDARNERSGDKLFENNYTRATTPKSHTIERSENYARPLYLSLDVLPRHLSQVIHDIAYREAVIDADRFLSDSRIRRGIESSLGREYYKQLRPWLQAIANDKTYDSRGLAFWDKAAHWARTSTTMVGLGYRIPTMLIHGSTAMSNSIGELGPKWMASGARAFFGSPEKMAQARDFVFERSTEMKNRMNETDRDIRDSLREMEMHASEGPLNVAAKGLNSVKRFAFYGIAALDMASAMPTWLGAYNRALDGGRSEEQAIYEADKSVRNAHGAGGVKDSASIQRGTEFQKLFTMFYSFWNHFYNRQRDIGRTIASLPETLRQGDTGKAAKDFSMVLSRSLFYFIIPQLLHAAMKPKTQNGDEDNKGWASWAAEEVAAGLFSGIPVLRDLVDSALTGRDYNATPAAQIATSMGKSAKDIAGSIRGDGASDKWVSHAVQNAGYVFGLPTGQLASTGQFLWDVIDGNQYPSSMSDWFNGIAHGRTSSP